MLLYRNWFVNLKFIIIIIRGVVQSVIKWKIQSVIKWKQLKNDNFINSIKNVDICFIFLHHYHVDPDTFDVVKQLIHTFSTKFEQYLNIGIVSNSRLYKNKKPTHWLQIQH